MAAGASRKPTAVAPDAHHIYRMAQSFYDATSAANSEAAKRLGAMSGAISPDQIYIVAPGVILSAFTLELLLKCILALEGKRIPHEHKLAKLFKSDLSKAAQTRIEKWYEYLLTQPKNAPLVMPFDAALSNSSEAFEYFRYFYENTPSTDKGWTGSIIADAAFHYILEIRSQWR